MSASRQAALGIFLVGGLLLFAVGIFWIGDRRQLFAENIELYAEFRNVSALSRGAKVRVAGMDAGEVIEVQLPPNPDSRFRVRFRVVSAFQQILRADSVASIQTDGLVGNKFLQVDAGTGGAAPVSSGSAVMSRETVEIADLMQRASETVATANEAILDIRAGIDETVNAVLQLHRETVEVVNGLGVQVERFTTTGNQVVENVNGIVAGVRAGNGTLGKLLNDDELYERVRQTAQEAESVIRNAKDTTADLKAISGEIKSREFGARVQRISDRVEELTQEAVGAIRAFQGQKDRSGGLMAEVRQTLTSANQAMASFAENTEALKRNFLFRGFFNRRGFFDLDAVTVREYQEGRFLRDHQKFREWIDAGTLFAANADGTETLTDEGKRHLERAMATFLRHTKNDPFIIESWAGAGDEPDRILRSRERGILVRDYLMDKFALKPNYVGVMPMNAVAAAGGPSRNGVELVLFAPDARR